MAGRRTYKIMADSIFWFHILWVIFLLSSMFLVEIYPALMHMYMAAFTTTIVAQVIWKGCPLVYLETWCRTKYDPDCCKIQGSLVAKVIKKSTGMQVPGWVVFLHLLLLFTFVYFLTHWR